MAFTHYSHVESHILVNGIALVGTNAPVDQD